MRLIQIFATIFFLGFAWAQSYQELDTLGAQLYQKGDYQGALAAYQKSLEQKISQLGPDSPITAQGHTSLGILYIRLNQTPQALEQFQTAGQIIEKTLGPQSLEAAGNSYWLGETYIASDDYPKAFENYSKAQTLFDQKLGIPNSQSAYVQLSQSSVQIRLGNYPKALELAQQASAVLQQTLGPSNPASIQALHLVAECWGYLGKSDQQLQVLGQILNIQQNTSGLSQTELAYTLLEIGETHRGRKEFGQALGAISRALEIYKSVYGPEHPVVAENAQYLAQVYADLGDFRQATGIQEKSIAVLAKTFGAGSARLATEYHLLVRYNLELPDYPKALQAARQMYQIYVQNFGPANINTAVALATIGNVYQIQSEFVQSLEYHNQAVEIVLAQQAVVFQALGNAEKLIYKNTYKDYTLGMLLSVAQLPQVGLEAKQRVLDNWLSFKGSAFDFENGIWLLQQLAPPEIKAQIEGYLAKRQELAKLYTRTPENQTQLEQTQARVAQLAQEIAKAEQDLSGQTQAFRRLLALQRLSWKDLAALLKPDELYIDYGWFDSGVFVLTLSATGDSEIGLLNSPELLQTHLGAVRQNIAAGKTLQALSPDLEALYQALLGGLETQLKGIHTLIISPDGPLAFLPFELLSDGQQLLLQRFNIRYTPSARDLLRLEQSPSQSSGPAAVFGNPAFGLSAPPNATRSANLSLTDLLRRANLSPLPATEGEARDVAGLLGQQTRLFLGNAANQQNLFQTSSPKVLHLATHGFFVDNPGLPNPLLRVGIALAGAKASVVSGEAYGLLTALELSTLKLAGTQLVVLSACETALGEGVTGEGVAGLNQAFLTAGAQRVMLSLWKVPDQETATLMRAFYTRWVSGQDPSQALREAKLELMKQNLPPLYWGAFVLNGKQ